MVSRVLYAASTLPGISTFQLDIKCQGLTTALLGRALTQAKAGRLHILEEMRKALPDGPRSEVSHLVPSATVMTIDVDFIGKVCFSFVIMFYTFFGEHVPGVPRAPRVFRFIVNFYSENPE